MKCVNCGVDNKLRDRTANYGRCKNCNHQFAFEPTAMTGGVKFTDPFVAKLLDDISVNKTIYFTPKQLLYFFDKRLKSKKLNFVGIGCLWVFFNVWATIFFGGILTAITGTPSFIYVLAAFNIGFLIWLLSQSKSRTINYKARQNTTKLLLFLSGLYLVVGLGISINANSFVLFVIVTLSGMGLIYFSTRQLINQKNTAQTFLISIENITDWLQKWQSINGSVEKILPPASEANQPVQIDPEITNYSFDRVVVCQSTEIAHFLITNNFHFENNCAVLSVEGYPKNIFGTVLQMLRRNPELKVYALHNADPDGVTLVHRLRTDNNWFAVGTATIYDIGLSPRQVISNPKLFLRESESMARVAKALSQEIKQTLLPEEIEWLESGYFVELESFTPAQLLRIVTRGINRQDEGLILLEDEERNYTSIYAIESFG